MVRKVQNSKSEKSFLYLHLHSAKNWKYWMDPCCFNLHILYCQINPVLTSAQKNRIKFAHLYLWYLSHRYILFWHYMAKSNLINLRYHQKRKSDFRTVRNKYFYSIHMFYLGSWMSFSTNMLTVSKKTMSLKVWF